MSNEEKPSKFGDFEELIDESKPQADQPQEEVAWRVKFPQKGQFIGLVLQRLGGNRMSVKDTESKIRNCRVPGRFSRKFWIRPGDIVIVQPWEFDNDKADVIYHYKKPEVYQLRKRGMLDKIKDEF